jgi:hypothetical protein
MSDPASSGNSVQNTPEDKDRRSSPLRIAALLFVPCLIAALFSMREGTAPPLTLSIDRPALVFDTYMRHEGLDPIPMQPLLTPYFTFVNKGPASVVIQEVKAGCSCISPEITGKEIAPGQQGRVMLPIKTRNEPAGLREYITTVKYLDPKPREVTLTYKVVLPEKQVEIEPRVVMLMGKISSSDHSVITINDYRTERYADPMKIQSVVSSSPLFKAELLGQTSNDGVSRTTIDVRFTDGIPLGQHRGLVTITTNDETYPVVQVPIILGDRRRPEDETVSLSPDAGRVIVQSSDASKSVGTSITFTIPSKWKVSHVDTFPPQMTGKIEKTEPLGTDKTQLVVKLYISELPTKGLEQGNLTLFAKDGEDSEMVTVPISLTWR